MDQRSDRISGNGDESASRSTDPSPGVVVVGTDDIAGIIRSYVSEAGYDVTDVPDVATYADRTAAGATPELVVVNVDRSMLAGGELQLDGRFEDDDVAVLAVSGPTIASTQVSNSGVTVADWLTKPFQRSDLVDRIERAIERGIGRDGSGSGRTLGSHAGSSASAGSGTNGDDPRPTTDGPAASGRADATADEFVAARSDDELGAVLDRIDDLETSHEAALDRIEEFDGNHEALAADVEALTERFADLSDALTMVRGHLDTLDDRIAGVDDRTDAIDDRVDAIEADVADTRSTVDSLSDGIDAIADEQQRLNTKLEEASGERAELRSAIESITEWQADVSTAFNAIRSDE